MLLMPQPAKRPRPPAKTGIRRAVRARRSTVVLMISLRLGRSFIAERRPAGTGRYRAASLPRMGDRPLASATHYGDDGRMTVTRRSLLLSLSLAVLAPLAAQAQRQPGASIAPVTLHHGMVVAQEARAARVGADVLRNGGNAVDAAVATGFALAVSYPRAGNIGGGGYMLIHLAGRNMDTAIDYRETAPAATTRDIFLDDKGEADPRKSRDSALGIGVPGTVAGLALAHAKYGSGKFTLAQLLAPAIALARDGIPVEDDVADTLPRAQARFARWPASARIFLHADGTALRPGEMLVQSDLAATLTAIAEHGPRVFY